MNADRDAKLVDFLWLLLPLAVLAAFRRGAEPAGLAVGSVLYVVGPLLGGLIMLEKGRSVRAGLLIVALSPSSVTSRSSASQATGASTCRHCNEAGESSCPDRPARARTRAPDLDCSPRTSKEVCPGRRPAGVPSLRPTAGRLRSSDRTLAQPSEFASERNGCR